MEFDEKQMIIKQLELIKELILLQDDEQVAKVLPNLGSHELNLEMEQIIKQLKNKKFVQANLLIESYINKHTELIIFINPAIEVIRNKLKILAIKIKNLENTKAEIERIINTFNIRYNSELGELILKNLENRKEKFKNTPKGNEAKRDYEDFKANFNPNTVTSIFVLTKEEQIILKEKYRLASKICHPDVVLESQKENAHKLFTELNSAYRINDLKKVIEPV